MPLKKPTSPNTRFLIDIKTNELFNQKWALNKFVKNQNVGGNHKMGLNNIGLFWATKMSTQLKKEMY